MNDCIGYELDDGGRQAAHASGTHGRKAMNPGDCVTRATAILIAALLDGLGVNRGTVYDFCYALMSTQTAKGYGNRVRGMRSARDGVFTKDYSKVFKRLGIVEIKQRGYILPTLTEAHAAHGSIITHFGNHLAAIDGGALRDTWDSRWYYGQRRTHGCYRGVEIDPNAYDPALTERKAQEIWVPTDECEGIVLDLITAPD